MRKDNRGSSLLIPTYLCDVLYICLIWRCLAAVLCYTLEYIKTPTVMKYLEVTIILYSIVST